MTNKKNKNCLKNLTTIRKTVSTLNSQEKIYLLNNMETPYRILII